MIVVAENTDKKPSKQHLTVETVPAFRKKKRKKKKIAVVIIKAKRSQVLCVVFSRFYLFLINL